MDKFSIVAPSYFSTTQDETELNVHRFTKRKTLVTSKLACKFYDTEGRNNKENIYISA